VVHRCIHGVAEPETEKNALLDPGVDPPACRACRVWLGGADGPGRQLGAQSRKRLARTFAIGRRAVGDQ
jgi:hypothetical protein